MNLVFKQRSYEYSFAMDGKYPEDFKCPVCLDIPKREIFQCHHGHIVCSSCVQSLSLCPQCRVSLSFGRIRNIALEQILDKMKFDGSYKSKGCKTKVPRKDITSHFETCWFGGEQVTLCKYLGFNCSHIVNTKRLLDAQNHLQQKHGFISTDEKEFDIKAMIMCNFVEYQYRYRLWRPIIVNAFKNPCIIVICSDETSISFICISVGEEQDDNVQIKFRMMSRTHNMPVLEWTTKPVSHSYSKAILESPSFKFPYSSLLEKYLVEGDLMIQVNIMDTNCNIRTRSSLAPVIITCIDPQSYLLRLTPVSAAPIRFGPSIY